MLLQGKLISRLFKMTKTWTIVEILVEKMRFPYDALG